VVPKPPKARCTVFTLFLRLTLCCVGLGLCCCCEAQPFSPAVQDAALLTSLYSHYQQSYKEESDHLPAPYKKDYQECYQERWKNIEEKFTKQEIYTSSVAQAYLDALVAGIVKNNPLLNGHPFHCYFSRSSIPNASYIGEGIILFNMGLFYRLANEGQAIFVLCHEISHCYLQHPEKSIGKYVTTINSEAVQAQLRKIKGSDYRKHEQLQLLVKGLTFDSRRHSRDHEAEADSMAMTLMRNTPFDLSGALTTLALLDEIDTDPFDMESCLRQVFDPKEYPFRKKWIAREEGLLGGHARVNEEKEITDSLKTHPDCQKRILLLRAMMKGDQGGMRNFVVDSALFVRLQNLFRYEVIEYAYASNRYTESLFLDLRLQQVRPGDVYLVSQVGRVLNGLYAAQKGHYLGKVADLPSPEYPENYNLLLQFVQNLYLEDLASIGYYYLKRYHPQLDYYPSFKSSFDESEKLIRQ
jgi:Zn-dependent protease with chaperone function